MRRALRILAITAALSLAGAVFGGLAGAVSIMLAALLTERTAAAPFVMLVVGLIGGTLGAVTAPVLAWLLLRRIPFGTMFAQATAGTVMGGVIGWIVPLAAFPADSALLGALAGCVVASVAMRSRASVAALFGDDAIDLRRALSPDSGRRVHGSPLRR